MYKYNTGFFLQKFKNSKLYNFKASRNLTKTPQNSVMFSCPPSKAISATCLLDEILSSNSFSTSLKYKDTN